jgi:chromosome segregation ATPase
MEALEMERPMTEWNDDRLDELNMRVKEGFADVDKRFERVDERFDKVDERFEKVEGEMKEGFARVDRELKDGFTQVNERFDRIYYLIVVTVVGLAGALLASNVWG